MTPTTLHISATILFWSGLAAAFLVLARLARRTPSSSVGTLFLALLALATIAMGNAITFAKSGLQLPLVWPVMPFSAWLAAASFAIALIRTLQTFIQVERAERRARFQAAILWASLGFLMVLVYGLDSENSVKLLTGGIPMSIPLVLAVLGLALAFILVTVATNWSASSRGWPLAVARYASLLVGSVVFGLPFIFLLITSFKEDRDMSSAGGIVWVPRVQQTMPLFDKANPLYEVGHDSQRLKGVVVETLPQNRVRLEILEPKSMQGRTIEAAHSDLKEIPRNAHLVTLPTSAGGGRGAVVRELEDGKRRVRSLTTGEETDFEPAEVEPIREVGLRWQNYPEALSFLPPETRSGLVYLRNTLILVVLSVIGAVISSSLVAYAFARMRFPGRDVLFGVLLATMMLPGAVTMLPQFLVFRSLGWIDTLLPLWVPAFLGTAFNIFLLRQFLRGVPMELEDSARIDGCSYLRSFWSVMLPQIKPALAAISVWTFIGAWNNFMGAIIYVNSPEKMPLSYALQLYMGDRNGEPGLLMAFTTMTMVPVLILFFFAQKYFIEGITLSGFGGR